MAKVFVSYSRKDIEFARRLTAELQKCELDFWIDWEDISPTVDWWKEIEKGIEEADVFIFLISPDSSTSSVCGQEIDTAVKNAKRIIPLVVRDIKGDEAPKQLSHLNWIFFRPSDDFAAAFQKLQTAIHTDYEWVQQHRWLQVRALDWERDNKDKGSLLRGKDLQDAELQLALNSSKEPHPTDLQREYVLESRKATESQKRIVIGISIAGLIALAFLAIWGWGQAALATNNASTAETESTRAVSNFQTAQAAKIQAEQHRETAIANLNLANTAEAKASRQAEIALARQLAVQAQPLFDAKDYREKLSVLLATQSMKLFPSGDVARILQNTTLGVPIGYITDQAVTVVAISPDGRYAAAGANDRIIHLWDIKEAKDIPIPHDGPITAVAFSADGKQLVSASCEETEGLAFCPNAYIRVWDVQTGQQVAQTNYPGFINSVTFSPDGTQVALGSNDRYNLTPPKLWDLSTGREFSLIYTIEFSFSDERIGGDFLNLRSGNVAFSPDGRNVAYAPSNTVHIWDTTTGNKIADLPHTSYVTFVQFSSDGKRLLSGSWDQTARIWDVATGNEIQNMIHDEAVMSVDFSPNNEYVVSATWDGTIRIWNAADGKVIRNIPYPGAHILQVTFNDLDGRYVVSSVCFNVNVSSCAESTVILWDVSTGQEVARTTHTGRASAAISADGSHVVSGGEDGAHIWKPVTDHDIGRMTTPQGTVYAVAIRPDGRYAASGGCEWDGGACRIGFVRVWDVAAQKVISTHKYSNPVTAIQFSPDGRYVIARDFHQTNIVLEISSGREMTFEDFGSDLIGFSADNMDISPDGQYVVTNGCKEKGTDESCFAHVWEISTGTEVARMDHDGPVTSVAFSPDGKYVASGSDDQTIRVWEAMTGKEIANLIHEDWVFSTGFSPDGNNLVSGSCISSTFTYGCHEAFVTVWDIANQKVIYRKTVDGNAMVVAYSPDGKYIVAGTSREQPTVFVWDARTGGQISEKIHDGSGSIYSLAFSLDSDNNLYILSTGCDQNISITSNTTCQKGSARVWEAATGMEIARMTHDGDVFTGAFSSDGTFVVSGGGDGVTYFWKWRTEDLIAKACTHLTHNLTHAEWKQYIGNTMDYQAVCPDLPVESIAPATQQ